MRFALAYPVQELIRQPVDEGAPHARVKLELELLHDRLGVHCDVVPIAIRGEADLRHCLDIESYDAVLLGTNTVPESFLTARGDCPILEFVERGGGVVMLHQSRHGVPDSWEQSAGLRWDAVEGDARTVDIDLNVAPGAASHPTWWYPHRITDPVVAHPGTSRPLAPQRLQYGRFTRSDESRFEPLATGDDDAEVMVCREARDEGRVVACDLRLDVLGCDMLLANLLAWVARGAPKLLATSGWLERVEHGYGTGITRSDPTLAPLDLADDEARTWQLRHASDLLLHSADRETPTVAGVIHEALDAGLVIHEHGDVTDAVSSVTVSTRMHETRSHSIEVSRLVAAQWGPIADGTAFNPFLLRAITSALAPGGSLELSRFADPAVVALLDEQTVDRAIASATRTHDVGSLLAGIEILHACKPFWSAKHRAEVETLTKRAGALVRGHDSVVSLHPLAGSADARHITAVPTSHVDAGRIAVTVAALASSPNAPASEMLVASAAALMEALDDLDPDQFPEETLAEVVITMVLARRDARLTGVAVPAKLFERTILALARTRRRGTASPDPVSWVRSAHALACAAAESGSLRTQAIRELPASAAMHQTDDRLTSRMAAVELQLQALRDRDARLHLQRTIGAWTIAVAVGAAAAVLLLIAAVSLGSLVGFSTKALPAAIAWAGRSQTIATFMLPISAATLAALVRTVRGRQIFGQLPMPTRRSDA